MKTYSLQAAPTLRRFMLSKARNRIVVGPIGSGKTTAMCLEVGRIMQAQEPSPRDNLRYTKFAIVRNTFKELETTTLKTWQRVFPHWEDWKRGSPIELTINRPTVKLPDGSWKPGVSSLVEFFPLDGRNGEQRLMSWEGTMVFFNEMRFIEWGLVEDVIGRLGRYPSVDEHNVLCTRAGYIGDTNPPDEDHEIAKMETHGAGDEFVEMFRQPPGIITVKEAKAAGYEFSVDDTYTDKDRADIYIDNPLAENKPHLIGENAYRVKVPSVRQKKVDVQYRNKYGSMTDSLGVTPGFNRGTMVQDSIAPVPGVDLLMCADLGSNSRNPAAHLFQYLPDGSFHVYYEFWVRNGILQEFSDGIHAMMAQELPNWTVKRGWGDPAGKAASDRAHSTAIDHMNSAGFPLVPAETNDIRRREEALNHLISKQVGRPLVPAFIIHPRCEMTIAALNGQWKMVKINAPGEARYRERPDKGLYSDVGDSLTYGALGVGAGRVVAHGELNIERTKPHRPMQGIGSYRQSGGFLKNQFAKPTSAGSGMNSMKFRQPRR